MNATMVLAGVLIAVLMALLFTTISFAKSERAHTDLISALEALASAHRTEITALNNRVAAQANLIDALKGQNASLRKLANYGEEK